MILLILTILGAYAAFSVSRADALGRPDIHINLIETYNFPDDGATAAFHVNFHNDGTESGPFEVKIGLVAGSPAFIHSAEVENVPSGTASISCIKLSSIAVKCMVSGMAKDSDDAVIHLNMISTDVRGGSARGQLGAHTIGPDREKDPTDNEASARFFVFEDGGDN